MNKEKESISLEFARDIGLVPKVDVHDSHFKYITNEEFKERDNQIIDKYCFDKKNLTCKFDYEEILNAINKQKKGN